MTPDRVRDTLGERPARGPHGRAAALEEAGATLVRASTFLRAAGQAPAAVPARSRAHLACNALRELDRFLDVLVDEAAATLDGKLASRGFGRLRNVPNKLRAVHAVLDLPSPGHERLRAIGRVRECLHRRRGEARDAAIWDDLAVATGHPPAPAARGAWLVLATLDLTPICAFYEAITLALLAALRARSS